ncbi:spore germination protein [Alicyclobacillus fastidiosus]|uniref:Spore germination protein n=2 Tax=Alicyclobacillus fastidiosus TaxID=392011 RepID=A0ABV5AL99_9BACL|nr:spore germination protein [Alicyclobacillus fastidiosus]WAH44960.1 spore germination protein [Alicyclobacillus fastidiosus]WEH11959.1 spore germination protein [Alicyclobacillus fastidiosus]
MNDRVLRQIFQNCSDVVFRPVLVHRQTKMFLIYVDGLNDAKALDEVVLKPMMFEGLPNGLGKVPTFRQGSSYETEKIVR